MHRVRQKDLRRATRAERRRAFHSRRVWVAAADEDLARALARAGARGRWVISDSQAKLELDVRGPMPRPRESPTERRRRGARLHSDKVRGEIETRVREAHRHQPSAKVLKRRPPPMPATDVRETFFSTYTLQYHSHSGARASSAMCPVPLPHGHVVSHLALITARVIGEVHAPFLCVRVSTISSSRIQPNSSNQPLKIGPSGDPPPRYSSNRPHSRTTRERTTLVLVPVPGAGTFLAPPAVCIF